MRITTVQFILTKQNFKNTDNEVLNDRIRYSKNAAYDLVLRCVETNKQTDQAIHSQRGFVVGSLAASFQRPLFSVDVSVCLSVCVSATLMLNISETEQFTGSCPIIQ